MFLLYEILLYLVSIVALPWFLILGISRGKYLGSFRARLGRYSGPAGPHDLWLHAVSVGEAVAAKSILDRVMAQRPSTRLVVTTTTATGQATAARLFPDATVTYFPFDFSFSVRRFLRHHRPAVFASIETEIWPNTVRRAKDSGIGLLLLNARLSDDSYPRYRAFRFLLRRILSRYAAILAREEADRQRFIEIGAPPEIVEVCGNVKFDFEPDRKPLEIEAELRRWLGQRKFFIAGSTMSGEDEMLLPALQRFIDAGCAVAIAPRKPERFTVVAELLRSAGIAFTRRSELGSRPISGDVLLLDTFGELARTYRLGTCAFVGGSLVATGGHNPIEPAAVGTPVAFGPHMFNFRDVAATFLADGAARQVQTIGELTDWVREMSSDPARRAEQSRKALATVERNRGAALRNAQRILEMLG